MSLIQSAARDRKKLLRIYRFISIFGILLLLTRLFFVTDKTFLFLLWNFFLAGIPLIISSVMIQMSAQGKSRNSIIAMGVLWLIFLPNAPYMLTDYIHVIFGNYDYFLLNAFTFSWFAIPAFVAAIISLNDISVLLRTRYSSLLVSSFIFIICLVCSFGIYLGRELRFNSWDVILKPKTLVTQSMESLSNPPTDYHTWTGTMGVGLLLFMVYQGVKILKNEVE